MEMNNEISKLVCKLETIVGNQCYNPNSYNGWTGEEGCAFRYPVYYCQSNEELDQRKLEKTKDRAYIVDPECIETMKYKFGSNHLYIGDVLVEMLEYLEDIFDLNFNELSENLVNKRRKEMEKRTKKMEAGKPVLLERGEYYVGVDLAEGKYEFLVPDTVQDSHYFNLIDVKDINGEMIYGDYLSGVGSKTDAVEIKYGNSISFGEDTMVLIQ